jgi:hypothetical protein
MMLALISLRANQRDKLHLIRAESHHSSDFANRGYLNPLELFICVPFENTVEEVFQIDDQVKPNSSLNEGVWYYRMRV